jgi:hypothetical protein
MFAFYSWGRDDYFYTTVPQMASAALWGTMMPCTTGGSCAPWYHSRDGMTVASYPEYPDTRRSGTVQSDWIPRAEFWVFTTPLNPKNASLPLVPLYRFSWRCGDWTPIPPAACSNNPHHIDTAYSADPVNGISYFEGLGYKLDGIEGYIYPLSMAQPLGTVRLMRKYNPTLDDHAIFPETRLSEMLARRLHGQHGLQRLDRLRLPEHQRQRAGDPVTRSAGTVPACTELPGGRHVPIPDRITRRGGLSRFGACAAAT